jgi:catechol 2,3-dioxygenase-like lactoylglutathione lyase family enzyme
VYAADLLRTIAFYRDALGFQIEHDQAVCGPATLQFSNKETAPSVIFLETDNVERMRTAIAARGGRPSERQKVNWIKMEMFEVRDPDGNTLWFGQSYDRPHDSQRGQLKQALPELPFTDVAAAVVYYRDTLGFKINYQQHDLGVMDRDSVTVLLIARSEQHSGIGSAEFYIASADALYAELHAKGANLQGKPVSHPWGLRDFRVLDLEGNRLTFAQTFE